MKLRAVSSHLQRREKRQLLTAHELNALAAKVLDVFKYAPRDCAKVPYRGSVPVMLPTFSQKLGGNRYPFIDDSYRL